MPSGWNSRTLGSTLILAVKHLSGSIWRKICYRKPQVVLTRRVITQSSRKGISRTEYIMIFSFWKLNTIVLNEHDDLHGVEYQLAAYSDGFQSFILEARRNVYVNKSLLDHRIGLTHTRFSNKDINLRPTRYCLDKQWRSRANHTAVTFSGAVPFCSLLRTSQRDMRRRGVRWDCVHTVLFRDSWEAESVGSGAMELSEASP